MHNLPRYNEYFVLPLAVGKNDMMNGGVYPIVQLGYPAITNIFVVNQIIRCNEDPAITNIFFGTLAL